MKKPKKISSDNKDFHIKDVTKDVVVDNRDMEDNDSLLCDMEYLGYYDDLPDSDRAMTRKCRK